MEECVSLKPICVVSASMLVANSRCTGDKATLTDVDVTKNRAADTFSEAWPHAACSAVAKAVAVSGE